jgi:hypothetical protein
MTPTQHRIVRIVAFLWIVSLLFWPYPPMGDVRPTHTISRILRHWAEELEGFDL